MPELYDIVAKGAMRLSTSRIQTIPADWTILSAFDTAVKERGGIVCDPAGGSITVNEDAFYIIDIGINFTANKNLELEVALAVGSTLYDDRTMVIQARGVNKPVEMFWRSHANLNAGDVLTLRGKDANASSFDLTFKRTAFVVTKDS